MNSSQQFGFLLITIYKDKKQEDHKLNYYKQKKRKKKKNNDVNQLFTQWTHKASRESKPRI